MIEPLHKITKQIKNFSKFRRFPLRFLIIVLLFSCTKEPPVTFNLFELGEFSYDSKVNDGTAVHYYQAKVDPDTLALKIGYNWEYFILESTPNHPKGVTISIDETICITRYGEETEVWRLIH
jgi:hypothetical protein